jgi:hypothetical protein
MSLFTLVVVASLEISSADCKVMKDCNKFLALWKDMAIY